MACAGARFKLLSSQDSATIVASAVCFKIHMFAICRLLNAARLRLSSQRVNTARRGSRPAPWC
eukprot:6193481-Pleurochrysis_carterae.AAC.1